MAKSAEAYVGDKLKYYIDLNEVDESDQVEPVKHSDIMKLSVLQQFIGGLLQNTVASVPFVYTTEPTFNSERELISVHSPVQLTLTDTFGHMAGRVVQGESTTIVTDIPGSSYFEIGGATYIIVPNTTDYDVRIEGAGEGSYTLRRELLIGEQTSTRLSEIAHATTTSTMVASFTKRLGVYSDLSIDYDGNGTVDEVMTLEGEPPTYALFSQLRDMVTELTLLKESEKSWLVNAITRAERTGTRKGIDSSGVARIFSQIDDRLITYKTDGRVSDAEYTLMKSIMQEIMSR